MQAIRISENKRFLTLEDGSPFFWLGDTEWELFHALTLDETREIFAIRKEQGFNVIQAVLLAERDGLGTPNAHGRLPLLFDDSGAADPLMPDLEGPYSYWDHVDAVLDLAEKYGLYIALLPTWGDKFHPTADNQIKIFNPENAYRYGQWVAKRFSNRKNLIWVLGGDRSLFTDEHREIVTRMAKGISDADKLCRLKTFHPSGWRSSSDDWPDADWLDFHMIQSCHSEERRNDLFVRKDYDRVPVKPVLDGEPRYEDHPISFKIENGYFDAADVRQAAYYAVFSGAFGHTYGHHAVWSMNRIYDPYFLMTWREALNRPAANQMKHFRSLIESRSFFDRRPARELLNDNLPGLIHQVACRGDRYAMVYSPIGARITLDTSSLLAKMLCCSWFNPRDGRWSDIGVYRNEGRLSFMAPNSGRGEDLILVLDLED